MVLPCYNEEAVLSNSIQELTVLVTGMIDDGLIADNSRILFVNDGSKDGTWSIIRQFHHDNPYVCGVNLAGNVGHQYAIMAGMETARQYADAVITLDADIQDDITKIPEMVQKYKEGCDIVYGVKNERKADSLFKRLTAKGFYFLMHGLGVKSIYNHADFRLLSKRALDQLSMYPERNLYLRGIIPLMGYKHDVIYEDLRQRKAGESKYTLKKMLNLAIDGITSFSTKPIRLLTIMGMVFVLIAFLMFLHIIVTLISGKAVAGWSSLMLSMWFIGGCIMIGLGIVGEYIGKIYIEVKQRPRYNIEMTLLK